MNNMIKRLMSVTGIALSLVCGLAIAQQDVVLPKDLSIVKPAASLSPELRALSGKWYGAWDNYLDHVLVVEKISSADDITFVYAYGTARNWNILKPGWQRVKGKFESGALTGVLKNGAVVTYRLQPDDTMRATYERDGHTSRATLKKMSGGS
jgi:hypothetical protein